MATKKASKPLKTVRYGTRSFDEVILTKDQALKVLAEWQAFLGLADWAIVLKILPENKMTLSSSAGAVQGSVAKNIAWMELLDPADYGESRWSIAQDMEKTIVHELLHILLYPLKIKSKLEHAEELVVERLSSALVALKRGRLPQ